MHISPNNKFYVGITSTKVENRWGKDGHGYSTQYFSRAIKKYGWDNFIHIVTTENVSRERALELEKLLIKQLNSNSPNTVTIYPMEEMHQ